MNSIQEIKNWYLDNFKLFEEKLNGDDEKIINSFRKNAIENFSNLNFPTTKDEEWKYTNISPILNYKFKPVLVDFVKSKTFTEEEIKSLLFSEENFTNIIFINGVYSVELSSNVSSDLLIILPLSKAIKKYPEIIEKYIVNNNDINLNIFNALNSAFAKEGIFIFVKPNQIIEKPIQILFFTSSNEEIFTTPRNLILLGENSQAKIIESYAGLNNTTYFTSTVSEIILLENAVLEHIKYQNESLNSFHIANMEIDLERSSNFKSININFGGLITRNNINAKFNDEYGTCQLNGVYVGTKNQLTDNHTMIDHAKPNCQSHESYKGILKDNSHGVFNGKIMVRRDAQKTNALQENKTLLLSKDSVINSKPQLEIFADDVKCTHGAAIGQLDDEALFYLQSRGISEDNARKMLINAFISEVVELIDIQEVKEKLEKLISEKI